MDRLKFEEQKKSLSFTMLTVRLFVDLYIGKGHIVQIKILF